MQVNPSIHRRGGNYLLVHKAPSPSADQGEKIDIKFWYESLVMVSETERERDGGEYLEGDVVVLGVDLPLLRQAAGVLRLQQVDADPVVEQPMIQNR